MISGPIVRGLRWASIATATLLYSASSAAVDQLTLDSTLRAIESNPEVRARWHALKAAGFDITIASGAYRPTVDLSLSSGKEHRDFDQRGRHTTTTGEISLTQMLFDGFRTRSEVRRLSELEQQRYYELLETIEEISLESLRAIEDVVRYRTLLDLAQDNYAKHLDVFDQIEERVQSGVGRGSDLDQVTGRVALAESNVLTEASNLHDVSARFLRIVGRLPTNALQSSEIDPSAIPDTMQEALQTAYYNNPGFHSTIKNLESSQAFVETQRSTKYPRLELRARQNSNRNFNGFDDRVDAEEYGDNGVIELALTYNLYNGGSDRAAIRSALEQVNEARELRNDACIDVRQTAQIAYNDHRRLLEQRASLQQHKDSIDNVRKAYAEQFEIGQRTLLDMLDAENEYFEASRALVNARHDTMISRARTLSSMGILLEAMGISNRGMDEFGYNKESAKLDIDPDSICPDLSPLPYSRDDLIAATRRFSTIKALRDRPEMGTTESSTGGGGDEAEFDAATAAAWGAVPESANPAHAAKPSRSSQPVAVTQPELEAGAEQYIVKRGDIVGRIAQAVRPDERIQLKAIIAAIYRLNPTAFINDDLNRLIVGAALTLPSEEDYQSMPLREQFRSQ